MTAETRMSLDLDGTARWRLGTDRPGAAMAPQRYVLVVELNEGGPVEVALELTIGDSGGAELHVSALGAPALSFVEIHREEWTASGWRRV